MWDRSVLYSRRLRGDSDFYELFSGLLSQNLAPHTCTLIGVDISSKSVAYYNERVANQGISPDEMKAICVELKERGAEGPDLLDGIEFDIVVVRMLEYLACTRSNKLSQCTNAYHHFDDIDAVTKILASYLKPGTGMLLVIDLVRSPTSESLHKDHGESNPSALDAVTKLYFRCRPRCRP